MRLLQREGGWPTVFSNVGHTYTHLFMLLYPTVVLALEHEMGLSYGELLTLSVPGAVLFGVGALPAGWLGDRWSSQGMLTIFFLGMGASAVLTGLASTPLTIALGLAAIGLFASIYHPVGMALLVQHTRRRGRALGINGVFGAAGTGLAAVVAGGLIDLIDWRAAFIVPGLVALLTGAGYALCWRMVPVAPPEAEAGDSKHRAGERLDRRTAQRLIGVLVVSMVCSALIYQVVSIAMPKMFAVRLEGLVSGTSAIGTLVTAVFLVGGAAQLVGGWLADRFPMKQVYLAAFVFQVPVLLLAASLTQVPFVAVAMVMVFLNVVGLPVENTMIARYTPERLRATAYGAKFVLAIGVSALAAPLVAAVYGGTGGFTMLFLILSGLAGLAMLAVAAFLPAERRSAPEADLATAGSTP